MIRFHKEISTYESEGALLSKNFSDEIEKEAITKAFFFSFIEVY